MTWAKININDKMRFQLTERGKKIWLDYWRPYTGGEEPTLPQETDGWCSGQMWSVMSVFGPHFSCGADIPIKTEILVEVPTPSADADG